MLQAPKTLPSQSYLEECFSYDPNTGELRWRMRPVSHFATQRAAGTWNGQFPGRICGRPLKNGRLRVGLNGDVFYAHRIIWKLVTGDDLAEVDHRNRQPSNNRWDNLRAASRLQNTQNRKTRRTNSTGLKGVSRRLNGQKFEATITVQGKRRFLGTFETAAEAHAAYCAAAIQHFGEYWSDGRNITPHCR